MRSVKAYIDILRKKGLRYSLAEGWRAVWPLWWTMDKATKDLIHQGRSYHYLKAKYGHVFADYEEPVGQVPKVIWICWLQGIEQAPRTVQLCYESVKKWAGKEFEIRVLTAENMLAYVTLPGEIITKYRSGRIPFAQFSDILRVSLLAEHGGIWMDATVMMTGEMPNYVTDGALFMYRGSWLQPGKTVASNWFLASVKGHPIMQNMRAVLIDYWQHENYLRDYYIFHILLKVLVETNEQSRCLFEAMPYIQNVDVHTMMFRAGKEPYSEALKADILSRSHIHKLSHKNGIDYHLYIQ